MGEPVCTCFTSFNFGKFRLPFARHLHIGNRHVLHHGMQGESFFRRHKFLLLAHHILSFEQGFDDGGTCGRCANTAVLHCLAHRIIFYLFACGLRSAKSGCTRQIQTSLDLLSLARIFHCCKQCGFRMQRLWFGLALRDGAARKSDMLSFLPVGNDLLLDLIVCCVCILVLPVVLFLERQRSPASLSDDGATDAKLNFMIHLRRY